nr:pre-mRNA-splicing factor ATP-dependent RNA helicase DEAH7 [Tanacetum cinerariifolium]
VRIVDTLLIAFDGDTFYLGDEASVKKKEAEVAKRLVRKDGTPMTLAQSKKAISTYSRYCSVGRSPAYDIRSCTRYRSADRIR